MRFREVLDHLTGFSTPMFGVSWNPPKDERDIIRKLMTFLEDRRVLYYRYDFENFHWVVKSVIEIRHELTRVLNAIDEDSSASSHLRAMRAACRRFLDATEPPSRKPFRDLMFSVEAATALGELRATFGAHIGQLCVKYGIDIEKGLESILPNVDTQNAKDSG